MLRSSTPTRPTLVTTTAGSITFSKRYAFETVPDVSATFLSGPTSRGLYRTDRHQSPFCIKSTAPGAFAELFAGARGLPMLLSYSPFVKDGHPRMMTIDCSRQTSQTTLPQGEDRFSETGA